MIARMLARLVGHNFSMRGDPDVRYILSTYVFPGFDRRPHLRDWLLLHPVPFGIRFWWRRVFCQRRPPLVLDESGGVAPGTVSHNLGNVWRIRRHRMEHAVRLLQECLTGRTSRARVLLIGPRNDAEVFLMTAYGFARENITAIDLISVSDWIEPMDMMNLALPDNSFDVVFASYVLPYCSEPQRALDEMYRVTKDLGLLVISWGIYDRPNTVGQSDQTRGLPYVTDSLAGKIERVVWHEPLASRDSGKKKSFATIVQVAKVQVE